MSRHTRRATMVAACVTALSLILVGTASASLWTKAGTAAGASQAGGVGAPTGITVPATTVTSGTVAVSWTPPSVTAGATMTFVVDRKSASIYTPACGTGTAPLSAATSSCNDTGVANGSYQYRVTAKVGANWATPSADSSTVTVTAAGGTALTIDTFTTGSGHTVSVGGKAAFGTSGDATVVTIVYCKTSGVCTAGNTLETASSVPVNGTTGAYTHTSGNLGNNQTTYVRVTQARTAGALAATAGPVTA